MYFVKEKNIGDVIKNYFRKEGNYILRDSYRVYKIDYIDADTEKYYIFRNIKDGSYKRMDRSNVVDFTIVEFDDNNNFTYKITTAIPHSDNFKKMLIEEHIDDILLSKLKKEKIRE